MKTSVYIEAENLVQEIARLKKSNDTLSKAHVVTRDRASHRLDQLCLEYLTEDEKKRLSAFCDAIWESSDGN